MYVPLFSTDFSRFTVNPAITGSIVCFSHKLFRASAKADETEGSLFQFCLGTVLLFLIFFAFKGFHLQVFDILHQTEVPKSLKGLPFQVFWHYETISKFSFFVFFSNFVLFPEGLLHFFDILQQTGFSKSSNGPLFYNVKKT